MSARTSAALSMVAIVFALQATSAWAEDSPLTFTFNGQVVDASGKAVSGIVVREISSRDGNATAQTDDDGRFSMTVRCAANGWVNSLLVAENESGGIGTGEIDQDTKEPVKIVIQPSHELAVTVVDEAGKAVPGAHVEFLHGYSGFAKGETDNEGRFACRVPADVKDWSVYARKSKVGFDYATSSRGIGNLAQPNPLPPELKFKLDGARTATVKALDAAGKPQAAIAIGPWVIRKTSYETDINLSGAAKPWPVTDDKGEVTIDWLPAKYRQISLINRADGHYSLDHSVFLSSDRPETALVFEFLPLEKLSGRVTTADGRPAAGVLVHAAGSGANANGCRRAARTDAEGRYQLEVHSEQEYMVRAGQGDWASPIQSDIVVRAGKPVANVDLVLLPATRVRGQVTIGKDRKPVPNAYVYAQTTNEVTNDLPRKPNDRTHYLVFDSTYARADDQGRYELKLGPGDYSLRGPNDTASVKITIPKEHQVAEVVQDFHVPSPDVAPFELRVVDGERRPVPKAIVTGRYSSLRRIRLFREMATDEKGIIKVERSSEPLLIHAKTADRKLAGVLRSPADETNGTIVLRPTGSAKGVLHDLQGRVLRGQKLTYGINVHADDPEQATFSWDFGGSLLTDGEGRFTLEGLVSGEKYDLIINRDDHSSSTIKAVSVKYTVPLDLGVLTADPEPVKPYVPPTPAERAAKAFSAKVDVPPAERLKSVLAEAKREYIVPLFLFGKPDDPTCVELFRKFEENDETADKGEGKNAPTAAELRWEFELPAYDLSRPEIREFAAGIVPGINVEATTLVVLSADGKLVETKTLALKDGKLDGIELGKWMAKHKLPTRDAEKMLAEAQEKANNENKRVYLIFSASWCGPCRMLARFLDPHKAELEKHFVFVKLDISRDENIDVLRERFAESQQSGVPWHCVVDPDGKVVATSNLAKVNPVYGTSNIGFPTEPNEVEHFLGMLKAGAPTLQEEKLDLWRTELLKK